MSLATISNRFSLSFTAGGLFVLSVATILVAIHRLNVLTLQEQSRSSIIAQSEVIHRVIKADLEEEIGRLRVLSRAIQNDAVLREAAFAHNQHPDDPERLAALRARMDAVFAQAEVSIFGIVARDGRVIYRAHQPDRAGDMLTDWGIVEAGRGQQGIASEFEGERALIYYAIPLLQGSEVIAVLKVGFYVDDRYAKKVADEFGVEIAFSGTQRVFARSWSLADDLASNLGPVRQSIEERQSIYLLDLEKRRTINYFPYAWVDETLCIIVMTDNSRIYEQLQRALWRNLQFAGLFGIGILFLGLLFLHWLMIRPLKILTRYAKDTVRVLPSVAPSAWLHGNEVSDLSTAFYSMRDALLEDKEQLEQRVEERTVELSHQAQHDVLTGLANRNRLNTFMNDAIKAARRRNEMFALLMLDLDGFKAINGSFGRAQGDLLLLEIARRLQGQVREMDLVARLGGDEFCLALVDVGDVLRVADVAERCLEALNAPFVLNKITVRPRASIGIALCKDGSETPTDLLKHADTAMYAAKHAGKHRYAFYDTQMTQMVERQMTLESALREAIMRGEFELHYQPQINLRDGRMHGVEALIRWRRPEHGLISPDEFIPVAEQIGLIGIIGIWVLTTACNQAVAWQRDGLAILTMAVNISPPHFESPGFIDSVAQVVKDTGITPAHLEIEVTESVTRNPELHAKVCASLQRLGVGVAIDDFGTGYSSLSVLKHLPINTLKVDKQFVQDVLDDPQSATMIGTLIGMAKGLNLATVAEGVETLAQAQFLMALGCPLAQGYYFSRPVPADQIPALARVDFLKRAADGQATIFPGDGQ